MLLAGGYGTRAKPFTDYFPKAMIPLNGRPVIDYIVRYLAKFPQISSLIILCEFDNFGKQVINYFEGKEATIGKPLTFIEDKKYGTGGALLEIERDVKADRSFLLWFADNLCALSVDDLVQEYERAEKRTKGGITGIVVVRNQRREETGRVILDNSNRRHAINSRNLVSSSIKKFIEKGVVKLAQPEALGIYLFNSTIFDYLHSISKIKGGFNLSHDLLGRNSTLQGKLYS
ncbi:MAG TPA: sugar phosphate nucleotidyltransferase [Candidatus Nitrosopolaris sp.]|nr:sugar phosphate nucleotidyltransferase [Candidatus Nitrosopolaris sp.]